MNLISQCLHSVLCYLINFFRHSFSSVLFLTLPSSASPQLYLYSQKVRPSSSCFFCWDVWTSYFFHTQTCLSRVNNYLWQTCPTEDVGTSSVISALKELVCSLFNSFFLYTIHIFCGSNIFMRKLFPSSPKMVLFTSRL